MAEQGYLDLPLAGALADLKERLASENPAWGNRPVYTCACCGERYPRGSWKCCAPPGGMSAAKWSARWHDGCPTADAAEGPGKRKCPHHCRCTRTPAGVLVPVVPTSIRETKAVIAHLKAKADSGARTSSLPVDEAFLKSEWPDDEKA